MAETAIAPAAAAAPPMRVAHVELDVDASLGLRLADGTVVYVTAVAKSGRRVRLRVTAPDSVSLKLPAPKTPG